MAPLKVIPTAWRCARSCEQFSTGRLLAAVVDSVIAGLVLKVVALPARVLVTFAVAGAQSPAVGQRAQGSLEGEPYGLEVRTSMPSILPSTQQG